MQVAQHLAEQTDGDQLYAHEDEEHPELQELLGHTDVTRKLSV